MHFLLPLTVAAVAIVQISPSLNRSESVLVRSVIDGETIVVATIGRVRLLGIEAPAVGRGFDTVAPLGRESRDRLAALVLNHWVRLEQETDRVGRHSWHIAYVMREDGVFVNAVLVREGLARVTARAPLVRLEELLAAQREAQVLRRGMWGKLPRLGVQTDEKKRRTVTRKRPGRYTAAVKPSPRRARSQKRADRPRPPQPAP